MREYKREEIKIKKEKKTKLKIRKITLVGIVLVSISSTIMFGINRYKEIEIEKQEEIKILEEQKIKEQEELKKLEELKKPMVGVNHDVKGYTYDAKKVSQKINSYDYNNNGEKVVFLTFDDGASTTVTPKILDVLEEYDVHATFFVTGSIIDKGGEESKKLIKEAFDNGNAIANHSYSHEYSYLYPNRNLNLENFKADFAKTDEILKDILGDNFSTNVLRCPGGHMSWNNMDELDIYLKQEGLASVDWNAINADAEGKKKTAQELVKYAIDTSKGKEMVVLLMHDTYGKEETAKALPKIIEYYKENGYEFKVLV